MMRIVEFTVFWLTLNRVLHINHNNQSKMIFSEKISCPFTSFPVTSCPIPQKMSLKQEISLSKIVRNTESVTLMHSDLRSGAEQAKF